LEEEEDVDIFDNGDNEEVRDVMEITIPPFAQGSPIEEVYRSGHLSFLFTQLSLFICT